jgi:hypothetical protein
MACFEIRGTGDLGCIGTQLVNLDIYLGYLLVQVVKESH